MWAFAAVGYNKEFLMSSFSGGNDPLGLGIIFIFPTVWRVFQYPLTS